MKTQTIVLATTNRGKLLELRDMLMPFGVKLLSLNDFPALPPVVEDGETFRDNALKKACFTAARLGLPAIADDSGLAVEALSGEPGVCSARYAGEAANDQDNIALLLEQMQGQANRAAAFHCVLCLALPDGKHLFFEGCCKGEITDKPVGSGGFGYDPLFFYPPLDRTFAQIEAVEKNKISHRGIAVSRLREGFSEVLAWIEGNYYYKGRSGQ